MKHDWTYLFDLKHSIDDRMCVQFALKCYFRAVILYKQLVQKIRY